MHEMGARQSKKPQRPPRPKAYLRFDDFEILRAIGRGAFGKVFYIIIYSFIYFYFFFLVHELKTLSSKD